MNEKILSITLEILNSIKENNLRANSKLILSSIEKNSKNLEYIFKLGVDCAESGRVDDAIAIFNSLKLINVRDSQIPYNLGCLHALKHDYQRALNNFCEAIKIAPNDLAILVNYASTLHELKKFDYAINFFDRALKINSECAHALTNKGVTLLELKQYEEALDCHDRALNLEPQNHMIWANKATLLKHIKQNQQSAECYLKAAELCYSDSYFLGQAHHQLMLICDWSNYKNITNRIFNQIQLGKRGAEPFGFQGIARSESLLQKCAEIYSNDMYPALSNLTKNCKFAHTKIHIGYLCGEFREHATSILMTRIWELHDKKKFKIFAFDSGYNDNSRYRQRINNAFDCILDISKLSDFESAKLIQANEIDILIDLNGYFGYERQGVFSFRPAPIQVNFLGFPGTLGAKYIDYIIADKVVLPETSRRYYFEKIIYLPNTYQPNDNQRQISETQISKSEAGLPEGYFVFACFNNNYKITPETFDLWSRILRRVDHSVLWLLADSPTAQENLRKEISCRGIEPARIIFATRLKASEHLARHRLADLFLDTLPYNAHTTSSDALWCGLPVLTLLGETFPGRVSASLLNAVGLGELITYTPEEYESMAVELATDPLKLQIIRAKLVKNISKAPLFDSILFTKHLESAFEKIYERHQANLMPDNILID